MHNTQQRGIELYITENGIEPFINWFESITDKMTVNRIERRIDRLKSGNFGDCKFVGDGVFELRLHFGSGFRIYFGEVASNITNYSVGL